MRYGICLLLAASIFLRAADVPTVKNGKVPIGKTVTLVLTEDLRFGSDEEEDHYLWASDVTDLEVDSKGHIYVADPNESVLYEFDPAGKFVRVVIPKGQGPGETAALAGFQFLADGSAVAFEGRPGVMPKFHYFDKNLKFVKQFSGINMGRMVFNPVLNPQGTRMFGFYMKFDIERSKMVSYTGLLDDQWAPLKEFSAAEQTANFAQFNDPKVLSDFLGEILSNIIAGAGVGIFDSEGRMYSALSNIYEVTRWSPDLSEKELIIKRDYKPIPREPEEIRAIADRASEGFRRAPGLGDMVNDAFIERVIEKADLPLTKTPIYGLLLMPDGHLLVVHDVHQVTGKQLVDIFNKEGRYVGQAKGNDWCFVNSNGDNSMVFRGDFAYTLETDEEGDNRVVRYRYKLASK
ncbi:MAG: 6-bladed beta-propeller [Acidobacteriota bacterium]|nr:6-bladed beta-propeller [Acidobacteriota bacterium]